jgi:uncharacterized membrane protein
MEWFYVEDGKRMGPVTEPDFQQLVVSGKITSKTLVWCAGMADWAAYESLAKQAGSEVPTEPGPTAQPETGLCRECGKTFPLQDMITYEGSMVCAECKPLFFQRVQEGAASGSAGAGGTGDTPNAEIMTQARASLAGNWGQAMGVIVVQFVISTAASFIPFLIGNIINLLIGGPLSLGRTIYFLSLTRAKDKQFSMLFDGFKQFGTALATFLLMTLFVMLWCLLLIVPGIIASLSYSQTFYILADETGISPMDAIDKSKAMMRGMKWKYFCLQFRFFGWALLCILTLGIGFLWLMPYMWASNTKFYDDVRGRATTA